MPLGRRRPTTSGRRDTTFQRSTRPAGGIGTGRPGHCFTPIPAQQAEFTECTGVLLIAFSRWTTMAAFSFSTA